MASSPGKTDNRTWWWITRITVVVPIWRSIQWRRVKHSKWMASKKLTRSVVMEFLKITTSRTQCFWWMANLTIRVWTRAMITHTWVDQRLFDVPASYTRKRSRRRNKDRIATFAGSDRRYNYSRFVLVWRPSDSDQIDIFIANKF